MISSRQVYLAGGSTDLRKSIDGLAVLVKEALVLDPFRAYLYFAIASMTSSRYYNRSTIDSGGITAAWSGVNSTGQQQTGVVSISYREFRWLRQELKVIPAQVKVVKHVQYIYACRQCERENITTPIIKAKMPNPILPGSLASPSILAYIMDQKYTNSLPLYRQEQQFSRMGIDLSRQTMANWLLAAADPWLKVIYDRMHDKLLERDILHADETTLQVLKEHLRRKVVAFSPQVMLGVLQGTVLLFFSSHFRLKVPIIMDFTPGNHGELIAYRI